MPIPADQITGIFETHLAVADLDRSLAFYCDHLGLTLASRISGRNVAFLWVGGKEAGMLGLWATGSAPLGMQLHFAFRSTVAGVLAICDHLHAPLGFLGESVTEPIVIGWMPAISVYVKDPDGHSIEFLSVLDAQPDSDFGVGSYTDWLNR
jgi:lactoylglutathione lyase